MKNKPKILLAEKEGIIAEDIERHLIDWGYAVPALATSEKKTFELVKSKRPDLVILDTFLDGDSNGSHFAIQITQKFKVSVILLSDWIHEKSRMKIQKDRSVYFVPKPFDVMELRTIVKKRFAKRQTKFMEVTYQTEDIRKDS
jgi:DNA-binding response OmpR family regulator